MNKLNNTDNSSKEERASICKELFGSVGEGLNIKSSFKCDNGYNIYFWDNAFVNVDCVFCDVGKIKIGNDVLIGPQVGIYAVNHPHDPALRKTEVEYGDDFVIGDNCWISGNATIKPGVTLGNNVVVASGAVVTKSFGDNVLIGGNPAKIVKKI